jgi:ketosteroid isomerase-like protein
VSAENVATIRSGYEVLARSLAEGTEEFFEWLDPKIEWRGPREFPDLAETRYGHDGVREYMRLLSEAIDGYRMRPEEFIDAGGDMVLVFSREGGRGRGSGAEVESHPTAHLWTLRDGRAVRMRSYWDRGEAMRAAGLEPEEPLTT